jgi:transcription antitermination factor NusG
VHDFSQVVEETTPRWENANQTRWYAVHTRAQHEKKVAQRFSSEGITNFLPLLNQVHRWSDRRKLVQVPLFPCYTFIQSDLSAEAYSAVLKTAGVIRIVGMQRGGEPIPDQEIENIRILLAGRVPFDPHPLLKAGQRVRVRGGALEGLEGVLISGSAGKLVISVEAIQRSLAMSVDGYDLEPI